MQIETKNRNFRNFRFWKIIYHYGIHPLLRCCLPPVAFFHPKIRESLQGREGFWQRLDEAMEQRHYQKPLVWFHVASAGEFLQAQPLMEKLFQIETEIVLTFSSITARKWLDRTSFAEGQRLLFADFLPWDTAHNISRLSAILQPSALIYVKFDLWPGLIWKAAEQGVPQFLISATLYSKSYRYTNFIGRSLFRAVYRQIDGIFCVTEEDRQRFLQTCPEHPNISVQGDTRYDSVRERSRRVEAAEASLTLPDYLNDYRIFIAGSIWPPDESCIYPGLSEALKRYDDLVLILVPHEPTEEHLKPAEQKFSRFQPLRLSTLKSKPYKDNSSKSRVILVDSVGKLSSLYRIGNLAYIGGAFTTGVHNTMEPCIMGLPVLFGPRFYNSPEAMELEKSGLGFSVNSPEQFSNKIMELLDDPSVCKTLGKQAKNLMESHCGAAERCFEIIRKEIL